MVSLYVGNLPFSATEEDVQALFRPFGKVSGVNLINDRETGQPRGFGFVEMEEEAARKAMQALNGSEMEGRALRINPARQGARRSPWGTR